MLPSFIRDRLALFVVLVVIASCAPLCKAKRAPDLRYELPDGYRGWVLVEWSVPGAPALEKDGGELVLTIPASGYLKTSTAEESGVRRERWVHASGGEPQVSERGGSYVEKDAAGNTRNLSWAWIGAPPATPRPAPPAR